MGKKNQKKRSKAVLKAARTERRSQGIRPRKLTQEQKDLILEVAFYHPLSKLWRGLV